MTPEELVELLDEVFSYFDTLAEKYDLEKIKTIGDCYMVASGVPWPRKDHATIITKTAVEMSDYLDKNTLCGRKLFFRIGINSGPVVAGAIGRKSSFMISGETQSKQPAAWSLTAMVIFKVSRATYGLVRDHFDCCARGTIRFKGKGEMRVWYVVDKKRNDKS